jgi:hypothetical protein
VGGARFSAPVHTGPLGPTQPPVKWVPGLYPGVKRQGRGADHQPLSKRRGHERVGLYLYSPSGPQWPVIGRTKHHHMRPCLSSTLHTFLRILSLQYTMFSLFLAPIISVLPNPLKTILFLSHFIILNILNKPYLESLTSAYSNFHICMVVAPSYKLYSLSVIQIISRFLKKTLKSLLSTGLRL